MPIIDNMRCPNGDCRGTLFVDIEDGEEIAECNLCNHSWTLKELEKIKNMQMEEMMAKYDDLLPRVKELFNQGVPLAEIERQLKIPKNCIWPAISKWRVNGMIGPDELKPKRVAAGASVKPAVKITEEIDKNVDNPPAAPEKTIKAPGAGKITPPTVTWGDSIKSFSHGELLSYIIGYRQAILDMVSKR